MTDLYEQVFFNRHGPVVNSHLILGGTCDGETMVYIAAGECFDSNSSIIITDVKPKPLQTRDGSNKLILNFVEITYTVQEPIVPNNLLSYPQAMFRIKISSKYQFIFNRI